MVQQFFRIFPLVFCCDGQGTPPCLSKTTLPNRLFPCCSPRYEALKKSMLAIWYPFFYLMTRFIRYNALLNVMLWRCLILKFCDCNFCFFIFMCILAMPCDMRSSANVLSASGCQIIHHCSPFGEGDLIMCNFGASIMWGQEIQWNKRGCRFS